MHKFFAKTQFLGKKVLFLPQCHSTNEMAAELIREKDQIEGTTIITSNQTQGKGQRGNTWESEANKNITFSIILKPSFISIGNQFQLHIITTLAIHAVLFQYLGKSLKIKWPNDIYNKNNKLGGILIENTLRGSIIEHSVIGIGININQLHFSNEGATSLQEITNQEFEINDLIEKIIIELEKKYLLLKSKGIENLKQDYLRRMYQFDEEKAYTESERTFTGKIIGINLTGKLQIQESQLIHEFDFKEVSFN